MKLPELEVELAVKVKVEVEVEVERGGAWRKRFCFFDDDSPRYPVC